MSERLYRPSVVQAVLRRHGFTIKKGLGQNFLIDAHVLDAIVEAALAAGAGPGPRVAVEVGPGIGTLTQALLEGGFDRVIAIEKDRALIPVLADTLQAYDGLEIVLADAVKVDFHSLLHNVPEQATLCFVSNLPYYITTPLIMRVLESSLPFTALVAMVQKEVAGRIVAPPGGKDYGALTVAVQYYSQPEIIASAPPTCFIPPPAVESTVIRLTIKADWLHVDRKLFFRIVRAAFGKRRKTLANALASEFPFPKSELSDWFTAAGVDGRRRGETLGIEEFVTLAENYPLSIVHTRLDGD
ncbi:MAG: 16S rRNA (adenine(1518)-N(6)/adenine(1519)-N(6))-dimethyltransferase RsmA [Bacilli bacterium]